MFIRSSQQLHPGVGDGVILLVGECRPVHQILTLYISTKKYHFLHPFSDQTSKIQTIFQTWPLGGNYVIIS